MTEINYDRKMIVGQELAEISDLEDISLGELVSKYGESACFAYNLYYNHYALFEYRPETDDEYNKRIAIEEANEKRKQAEREARREQFRREEEQKEQNERAEYERLKAKFG